MKRLIGFLVLAFSCAATATPPDQPLATGRYEFQLRYAEHPNIKGIKLIAEIIDDHIELTNADSEEVYDFGVVAEGTLMWHEASRQWIIGQTDEDRIASRVGGCSEGPPVIDLLKLEYWTC